MLPQLRSCSKAGIANGSCSPCCLRMKEEGDDSILYQGWGRKGHRIPEHGPSQADLWESDHFVGWSGGASLGPEPLLASDPAAGEPGEVPTGCLVHLCHFVSAVSVRTMWPVCNRMSPILSHFSFLSY